MKYLYGIVLGLFMHPTFAIPEIQHWQTDNGVRVYFIEAYELPIVDIQITFDAGSARDGSQPGIAALTNNMLGEGADGINTDELLARFASLGAEFSRTLDRDTSSFSLRSLHDPTLLDSTLTTLTLILSRPDFPADAFARVQKRMLHALEYQKQLPGTLASQAFYRAIYGDHPYALPSDGTEESLNALHREDLQTFYETYYGAKNAVIAIIGALNRANAEQLAQRLSTDLAPGMAAPPLPPAPAAEQGKTIHIPHPSSQTHVIFGQISHSRYAPDYFTLFSGNHILGGNSLVSLLAEQVREARGLSYSVYSYFDPMREAGPFAAVLQTRNDQTEEAVALVREILTRFLADGPSAKELTATKQNLSGGFPLRIDSNKKLLGYLSTIGFYRLPLDYLHTWTAKVEAVSAEDVRTAFRQHLDLDKMYLITVGGTP
jgi:zinc protease